MVRIAGAGLLAASALLLGGCLPMMAASVANVAVDAAIGKPKNNEGAGGTASNACVARAATLGTVHVIDVEQHTPSTIIVWGTTEKDGARTSFKCSYGTKITAFKTHPLSSGT